MFILCIVDDILLDTLNVVKGAVTGVTVLRPNDGVVIAPSIILKSNRVVAVIVAHGVGGLMLVNER